MGAHLLAESLFVGMGELTLHHVLSKPHLIQSLVLLGAHGLHALLIELLLTLEKHTLGTTAFLSIGERGDLILLDQLLDRINRANRLEGLLKHLVVTILSEVISIMHIIESLLLNGTTRLHHLLEEGGLLLVQGNLLLLLGLLSGLLLTLLTLSLLLSLLGGLTEFHIAHSLLQIDGVSVGNHGITLGNLLHSLDELGIPLLFGEPLLGRIGVFDLVHLTHSLLPFGISACSRILCSLIHFLRCLGLSFLLGLGVSFHALLLGLRSLCLCCSDSLVFLEGA